jgi:hypothetical protein
MQMMLPVEPNPCPAIFLATRLPAGFLPWIDPNDSRRNGGDMNRKPLSS